MTELTTADVLEIIEPLGITPKQFRGWCEKEIIVPAEGGTIQGDHRKFTRMQAIGLAVAAKVYKSNRGCHPSYVGLIVAAFDKLTEEELRKRFKRGGTHFVTAVRTVKGGAFVALDGPYYPDMPESQRDKSYYADMIDVQETYREVLKKIGEIEAGD